MSWVHRITIAKSCHDWSVDSVSQQHEHHETASNRRQTPDCVAIGQKRSDAWADETGMVGQGQQRP